jgi:hypothetical protein
MSDAIGRLTSVLAEYEKAAGAVAEFEAKVARAISDEERSASDSGASEEAAIAAVADAQSRKSVYSARLASRQKAVTTLGGELWPAIQQLNKDRGALVHEELTRRRTILGDRVLEVIDALDRPGRAAVLAELLDFSSVLERVRALMPAPMLTMPGPEALGTVAKDAIEKFNQVLAAAKEEI